MDVNYINPFIDASISVLSSFYGAGVKIGKVAIKRLLYYRSL